LIAASTAQPNGCQPTGAAADNLSSSTPAHRLRPALFMLLREGGNASLEAVNKAFLCRQNSGRKNAPD